MNEPEKKIEGLTIEQKEMLHRALGRIEGIACACEWKIGEALLLSIRQIEEALGLSVEEEGADNAAD